MRSRRLRQEVRDAVQHLPCLPRRLPLPLLHGPVEGREQLRHSRHGLLVRTHARDQHAKRSAGLSKAFGVLGSESVVHDGGKGGQSVGERAHALLVGGVAEEDLRGRAAHLPPRLAGPCLQRLYQRLKDPLHRADEHSIVEAFPRMGHGHSPGFLASAPCLVLHQHEAIPHHVPLPVHMLCLSKFIVSRLAFGRSFTVRDRFSCFRFTVLTRSLSLMPENFLVI
mmetsp:Transcript_58798/g.138600  ORF Transcript_58798/g.138600 Transcript_58798/m.138600 type:complete len:224 (-) Transcript_58798:274-945(-)